MYKQNMEQNQNLSLVFNCIFKVFKKVIIAIFKASISCIEFDTS